MKNIRLGYFSVNQLLLISLDIEEALEIYEGIYESNSTFAKKILNAIIRPQIEEKPEHRDIVKRIFLTALKYDPNHAKRLFDKEIFTEKSNPLTLCHMFMERILDLQRL